MKSGFKLRRLGLLAVSAAALTTAVLLGSVPAPTKAAGSGSLTVTPSTQIVNAGDTFTVTVSQSSSSSTTGAGFDLNFDETLIKVTDVATAPAYGAGSLAVGVSVPRGAAPFPLAYGLAEPPASCGDAADSDADGVVNDGCPRGGVAEVLCGDTLDNDGDGRVNDGCTISGVVAEKQQCSDNDAINDDSGDDAVVNDGCTTIVGNIVVGSAELTYMCFTTTPPDDDPNPPYRNTADDDGDGRINDGCLALGRTEAEGECPDNDDDDLDGLVNDGCPQIGVTAEIGAQCLNNTDDDLPLLDDNIVNDGCTQYGGAENDVVCQDGPLAGNNDFDGDGRVNDGCPPKGPAPAVAPEAGAACTEVVGSAIDDDLDGYVNDGCAALGTGENIVACTDAVDVTPGNDPINGVKDNDSYINDGCPAHQTGDGVCGDAVDSDTDGAVNDGCGISGVVSEADQCANTTDDDLPLADDALVNDGCPGWGLPESGGECTDAADSDGDTMVNDGCPLAGAAEAAVDCGDFGDDDGDKIADDGCSETVFPSADCTDNLDNDHDGVINDGCYYDGVLSLDESGGQCDDISDNDSDGLVNDGCAATEPAAILSANATGVLENPTALLTVGSIGPGTVDAIVITMEALVVVCGVSPLDLTNAEMLDNLYDPLSPVTVTNGLVGISMTDADCDTFANPAQTLHVGPANTDITKDNCTFVSNTPQLNGDGNYYDNSPPFVPATPDDRTNPRSDAQGNSCETDDDNDNLPDTTETNLVALTAVCPTTTGTLNPLDLDTDNDHVADGAECAMGSDPFNILSKPAIPTPANDPDNDRLSTAFEAIIGTNPALLDTDGDRLADGVEFKGWNSNPLVAEGDGDGIRDCREVGSLNTDGIVNPGDQALLSAEIGRAVPATAKLWHFDMNQDSAYNPGDQALQSSFIIPGNCPV